MNPVSIPDRHTPRPTFAEVFADECLEAVNHWIVGLDKKLADYRRLKFIESLPSGDQTLRGLLIALAHGSGQSALTMTYNLEKTLDWPTDDDLYAIFKNAITIVQAKRQRERTIEWVMKTGMRFDRKVGEEVTFFDTTKNTNRRGKVVSVDRPTASAIVEVNDNRLVIEAERVVA